jgi:hypothetical protein
MSWDKNTISFSEVNAIMRVLDILGIPYAVSEIGRVGAHGLNDDVEGREFWPLRRLEFADKVVLERIHRHSDCDIDDAIFSRIFDKDKAPKRWRKELHFDDET